MKLFFRKHGNSLFYIILPLFFLALTITLIQFSPKISVSDVGDSCLVNEDCTAQCTTSICLPQECVHESPDGVGTCKFQDLGCPDGTPPVAGTDGGCFCDPNFTVPCSPCCVGDTPVVGCIECSCTEGSGFIGDSSFGCGEDGGCSLQKGLSGGSSIAVFYMLAMSLGLVVWFAARKRSES